MNPRSISLAVLACACTASGAHGAFQLALSLTARAFFPDSNPKTDVQTGGQYNSITPTTLEFEVRYRIVDLTSDDTGSRGLASARLRVSFSGLPQAVFLSRANLSRFQFDKSSAGFSNSTPALNPDSTGRADGDDPASNGYFTGLHGPFRDALTGDSDPDNAVLAHPSFEFVAQAASSPEQRSWSGPGDPSPANTNSNTASWGVFSFVLTHTMADLVTVKVEAVPDMLGNHFTYYERTGGSEAPKPVGSSLSQAGTFSYPIPAPGTAIALALGFVAAQRRHRYRICHFEGPTL